MHTHIIIIVINPSTPTHTHTSQEAAPAPDPLFKKKKKRQGDELEELSQAKKARLERWKEMTLDERCTLRHVERRVEVCNGYF